MNYRRILARALLVTVLGLVALATPRRSVALAPDACVFCASTCDLSMCSGCGKGSLCVSGGSDACPDPNGKTILCGLY